MRFTTICLVLTVLVSVLWLGGCGDVSKNYTFNRHLKNCYELMGQKKQHPRLKTKNINKCMEARGHADFDFAAYEEEHGPYPPKK